MAEAKLKGMVVYNFAYDIAYEMSPEMPRTLLGQELSQISFDSSRRNPRHMAFYRPLTARLPSTERIGPHGPIRVERAVKILPMGAISITIRVPFAVNSLKELIAYHDIQFTNGQLHDEVRRLSEEIAAELRPYLKLPSPSIGEEEAYTVFCIESFSLGDQKEFKAEKWLHENRREVAGLLAQESDPTELSDQEALESTSRFLSYYGTDLLVIDWDAALMIDEPSDFHEPLYIMELANLQLSELEAYDRLLDTALERSYRDLRKNDFFNRREMLARLREIRIDMARFADEISNITKFFGDWYFAKVYEHLSARFHLPDWHRSIEVKLKTLDQLYQLLNADQTNRWMLMLEATIVLLFIIDLIAIFFIK